MATIAAVLGHTASSDDAVVTYTFTPMTFTGTDVGAPIQQAAWSEKTWHAVGTFGAGGNITIEGSNDGTNWSPISTRQGTTPLNLTAALAMNTSQDRPVFLRPRVTAGDGTTSLTVIVACHRQDLAGTGR